MIFNRSIFLCGMPSAGKSTVGRHLATLLDLPFIDSDEWIEQQNKKSVQELFMEGEAHFRRVERVAIEELVRETPHVIALGGGSLQDEEVIALIKSAGTLIFIDVPLSVLYERVGKDTQRPLLAVDPTGRIRRLTELYEVRKPLYEMADLKIEVHTESSPEDVASLVQERIMNRLTKDLNL